MMGIFGWFKKNFIDSWPDDVPDDREYDSDESCRRLAHGRAKRLAKLRAEKNRIARAKSRLNDEISRAIQGFTRRERVSIETVVTAEKCKFKDFKTDMQPMTRQVEAAISTQVASEIGDAERELEELETLLQGIRANI